MDKDKHIAELESVIKDLAEKDELTQSSRSDLAARKFVEPHVKLNCNRFEIPVPLKNDVILPNNYVLARYRVFTLREKALKQLKELPFVQDIKFVPVRKADLLILLILLIQLIILLIQLKC